MVGFKFKNYFWNTCRYLADLNLSIFILFLITIFSVFGSIIEQNQSIMYYQINYPLVKDSIFRLNWKLIIYLGLDNIFQTWWFLSILLLFVLTLLTCTLLTQLPSLRNARRWKFIYSTSYRPEKFSLEENFCRKNNSLMVMTYILLKSSFFIFCQSKSLYAYKGLYGRISPIFVHFSIVTILIGSILSFFCGFTAQEIIPGGEFFNIRHFVKSGILSSVSPNILSHVDHFKLDYNLNGSIKQFISRISLFSSHGKTLTSGLLSVNHPFRYSYLSFYQTDWEVNGIKISINNNIILQRLLAKTRINNRDCWICSLPFAADRQFLCVIFQLNQPILVFNSSGVMIGQISVKESFSINQINFRIDDIIISTGLQIKSDLGIGIVYTGFFALMLSTITSYLSYSQVWFYRSIYSFNFLSSTNRSVLSFEEDVFLISYSYTFLISSTISNVHSINKTIL